MTKTNGPTNLQGVYALLATPFHEDKSIDWNVYRQYVEWQVSHRPHHLFAVCGSSEMTMLSLEERVRLASEAVRRSSGIPVVATANLEHGLPAQQEEIKRMTDTGVCALVLTTRGLGFDQQRLHNYLIELTQYCTIPVLLYEFPGYGNARLSPEIYEQLVAEAGISGVKDTTCTLADIGKKITRAPHSAVIQANIALLLDSYRIGAAGVMATTSIAAVQTLLKHWHAYHNPAGGTTDVEEWQAQIVIQSAILGKSFPASSKYFISLQGIPFKPVVRSASVALNAAQIAQLDSYYSWAAKHHTV